MAGRGSRGNLHAEINCQIFFNSEPDVENIKRNWQMTSEEE